MRYRTFPGADEDAQATCTEFTSARLAMGDAQEAGALLAFEERRYVASWAEEKNQRGSGASSSWIPMPFGQAKAILVAELRRNLDLWRGIGGSDPALYDQALERRGRGRPLAITLPGHVLRIEDTRRAARADPSWPVLNASGPENHLAARVGVRGGWSCPEEHPDHDESRTRLPVLGRRRARRRGRSGGGSPASPPAGRPRLPRHPAQRRCRFGMRRVSPFRARQAAFRRQRDRSSRAVTGPERMNCQSRLSSRCPGRSRTGGAGARRRGCGITRPHGSLRQQAHGLGGEVHAMAAGWRSGLP
jgi:hypothetical protein